MPRCEIFVISMIKVSCTFQSKERWLAPAGVAAVLWLTLQHHVVNKAVSHIQELKSKLENWGQQVEPNITRRWIVLLYTITDQDSTTRIQAIDQNQYHTDQTQIELTVIWIDSHVIFFALILHNEWIMNVSCLLGW